MQLTAEEIEQITGVKGVTFGEGYPERRRTGRLGVIGRAILCRIIGGVPHSAVGVRVKDISATGVHLLCEDHAIRTNEEFILGLERAGAGKGKAMPPLWVSAKSVRITPGGGKRTAIGAKFLERVEAPNISKLIKPQINDRQVLSAPSPAQKSKPPTYDLAAAAFYQAPCALAVLTHDHRFARVNLAMCELLGYCEHELMAKTFEEITHADDVMLDAHFAARLFGGELSKYEMEKRYIKKDGSILRALLEASLLKGADGKPLAAIAKIRSLAQKNLPAKAVAASSKLGQEVSAEELDRIQQAILDR